MSSAFSTIGIIGYGKFGQLLHELFQGVTSDSAFHIYDPGHSEYNAPENLISSAQSDLVVLACPIAALEKTLHELSPHIRPKGSVVIDVCTVKLHAKNCMESILPESVEFLCTHPMFGPATYLKANRDLSRYKIVVDKVRASAQTAKAVCELLKATGPEIVEMNCDEHDRLTARFQFTALSTAVLLKNLELNRSQIDTGSATAMMDFVEMVSVDKNLLQDMYHYNPYCKQKWSELERSFHSLQELFLQAS